jgi:signal transduction histidine kinase
MRTQEILMQNEEILVQAENLKDANEKIQAKNQELEAQKSELERRTSQLEISNATKNKFFRIIAHDLRSPISSFASITSFILSEFEEQGWEKTKIFLSELNKLSQTTYNLLENLLEWSTNQMGEFRYNPTVLNITSLVNENIDLIFQRVEIKMIRIFSALPPKLEVIADENMVNTIIRNLLSNAVKFTNENGSIKISYEEKGDIFEIKISDSGIGISEQDIEKIFRIDTNFSKPGTQNEKGSGLGLILCKDFIEKNGGNLVVVSKLGKGSTFSFTLKKAGIK